MKWLTQIFNFYLDASVHVAFAIYALLQVSCKIFDIPYDSSLSLFLFFGSISCYNFIKYGVEAEKYILVANHYHKGIQFFSLLTGGLAFFYGSFLNFKVWLCVGLLLFFTVLYALPVLPKAKNLRSWGGVKVIVVAFVWSGATVVLPILSVEQQLSWDVGVEAFQRFILILVLLIPFEIRDLAYDKPELKTWPQRFGVANIKVFGSFATLLFFFGSFLKDDISIAELMSKGVLFLTMGCLMFGTKRHQSKYFASFWVEAIPIFWWGIVALLFAWSYILF